MTDYVPSRSASEIALKCRCPRCGEGKLYNGLLEVRERCDHCDMDLSKLNAEDGAAFFIIVAFSAVIIPVALWVEFTFSPPTWVHMLTWIPVVIGGSVALMRPLKAWLVGQQFRHKLYDQNEGG